MSYEPPLKVSIAVPSLITPNYGVNSTRKRGGNLRVRCTNSEYDLIKEEADHLGISLAMFTRWCATRIAEQVKQHRITASTNMSIGDEDIGDSDQRTNSR
jgi:hypothetical protein